LRRRRRTSLRWYADADTFAESHAVALFGQPLRNAQ
jgi:hypothetical protein